MIDELELTQQHAEAIIERAIEFEAYSEEMPESEKDQQEAAHEIIAFALDSYIDDEVRPDSDDKDVAKAGEQIMEILEIAGIEIDDKNNVTYGELPEFEDDEEGDEEEGDDEAAFDINDIIDDYDSLKVAEVTAALEGLDEDDVARVKEYEENEGKGRKQILSWEPEEEEGDEDEEGEDDEIDLDELDRKELRALIKENELDIKVTTKMSDDDIRAAIAEAFGEEEEGDEEEGEESEEEGEEPEAEGDEDTDEEPWEGYDGAGVKDIKEALAAAEEDEDEPLTAEQVEYVLAYEKAHGARTSLVKYLEGLLENVVSDDDEEEGEEQEEEGEEEESEADDAKAKDDRKDSRRKSSRSSSKKSRSDVADELTEEDLLELAPAGLVHAFVNARLHDKQLAVAGLGAPRDWDGDMPEVPEDIATVDHDDLSNLLGQFSNALSTAIWNSSKAYIEAGFYEEIAEYLENVALLDTEESNDTKRKADARTSESVVAVRALHRSSYSDYVRFRDLAKTLEHRWRTVSRVGGFVGDEAEAEDASAKKSSTRGKSAGSGKGSSRGSGRRVSRR